MKNAQTQTEVQYADVRAEHPVADEFQVRDESSANWVVKKIVAARMHAKRAKDWADREVRRAQREEAFFLSRFGRDLQQWSAGQIRDAGGRRKSVSLPAGTVGFRTQKPKLTIDDEDTAITWAKRHCPAAVQTQERLTKTALNDHFEETGELPEGVRVEPAGECFYVK